MSLPDALPPDGPPPDDASFAALSPGRALRFQTGLGGAAPGLERAPSGQVGTVTGVAALRQSLLLLLLTRPGERVTRPDYGCPLDRLAFEPNDGTTAGIAIRLAADAIARFEPRVEILSLDAGPDPEDDGTLLLHLSWRPRGTTPPETLEVPVALADPSDGGRPAAALSVTGADLAGAPSGGADTAAETSGTGADTANISSGTGADAAGAPSGDPGAAAETSGTGADSAAPSSDPEATP